MGLSLCLYVANISLLSLRVAPSGLKTARYFSLSQSVVVLFCCWVETVSSVQDLQARRMAHFVDSGNQTFN